MTPDGDAVLGVPHNALPPQAIEALRANTVELLAVYRAAKATGRIRQLRVVAYRCRPRGCLLLDVFRTPAGVAVYLPPFKLSPEQNAATTDANARVTRTSDGVRRWIERAELLLPWPEYWLNCDHVQNFVVPAGQVPTTGAPQKIIVP